MNPVEFTLVINESPGNFSSQCSQLLKGGWQLHGVTYNIGPTFVQAFVR